MANPTATAAPTLELIEWNEIDVLIPGDATSNTASNDTLTLNYEIGTAGYNVFGVVTPGERVKFSGLTVGTNYSWTVTVTDSAGSATSAAATATPVAQTNIAGTNAGNVIYEPDGGLENLI